jgi:hypothetical protein
MQKNIQKYRLAAKYIQNIGVSKNLAHPKSLVDTKNLAHPKSLAEAKYLAPGKILASTEILAHRKN